ncbi:MAG: cobalamin-dependent protein [Pseudomonadota bacterium]
MKVCLISSNTAVTPYPVYPLGLSVIAQALSNAGHEVRQFDLLYQNGSIDLMAEEIRQHNPGLIGISVRNIDNANIVHEQYYIDTVKKVVEKIRGVSSAKVVLGGAGFSLIPEIILRVTGADYGIVGEGEKVIVDFANKASQGIYPDEPMLRARPGLRGMEIGSAGYDDELMKSYLRNGNIAPVQTKRGCTHKCIYCSYPLLEGAKIRQRNPGAVVDDIEILRDRHHARYIFFCRFGIQ